MNLVNPASDNNRLAGDRPPRYGKKDDFPRQEVPNLGNLGNEALARLGVRQVPSISSLNDYTVGRGPVPRRA